MEVFHASTQEVLRPDTLHSRKYLDFGSGFYVTTLRQQAVNYAERHDQLCFRTQDALDNCLTFKSSIEL